MTEKILKNPAASIRARLFNHAKATGASFENVLTRYAIERLLYRLSQTGAAERYVLKGAMLFVTWPEHAFRPTGDLDLLGEGDPGPDAIAALFARICHVEVPEDGVVFDPETLKIEAVREEDRYQGVQISLKAGLDRAVIHVQVDIGFGDHVFPAPTRQTFPALLAGLPQARLLMYPPETVVAEKFEAMIRFGEANGRIKDFYDIWVTTRTFAFDLASLTEAVGGTLQRRGTAVPADTPAGLTDEFGTSERSAGLWTGFLRRSPPTLQPPAFPALLVELRRFFGPVIISLGAPEGVRGRWDPDQAAWR